MQKTHTFGGHFGSDPTNHSAFASEAPAGSLDFAPAQVAKPRQIETETNSIPREVLQYRPSSHRLSLYPHKSITEALLTHLPNSVAPIYYSPSPTSSTSSSHTSSTTSTTPITPLTSFESRPSTNPTLTSKLSPGMPFAEPQTLSYYPQASTMVSGHGNDAGAAAPFRSWASGSTHDPVFDQAFMTSIGDSTVQVPTDGAARARLHSDSATFGAPSSSHPMGAGPGMRVSYEAGNQSPLTRQIDELVLSANNARRGALDDRQHNSQDELARFERFSEWSTPAHDNSYASSAPVSVDQSRWPESPAKSRGIGPMRHKSASAHRLSQPYTPGRPMWLGASPNLSSPSQSLHRSAASTSSSSVFEQGRDTALPYSEVSGAHSGNIRPSHYGQDSHLLNMKATRGASSHSDSHETSPQTREQGASSQIHSDGFFGQNNGWDMNSQNYGHGTHSQSHNQAESSTGNAFSHSHSYGGQNYSYVSSSSGTGWASAAGDTEANSARYAHTAGLSAPSLRGSDTSIESSVEGNSSTGSRGLAPQFAEPHTFAAIQPSSTSYRQSQSSQVQSNYAAHPGHYHQDFRQESQSSQLPQSRVHGRAQEQSHDGQYGSFPDSSAGVNLANFGAHSGMPLREPSSNPHHSYAGQNARSAQQQPQPLSQPRAQLPLHPPSQPSAQLPSQPSSQFLPSVSSSFQSQHQTQHQSHYQAQYEPENQSHYQIQHQLPHQAQYQAQPQHYYQPPLQSPYSSQYQAQVPALSHSVLSESTLPQAQLALQQQTQPQPQQPQGQLVRTSQIVFNSQQASSQSAAGDQSLAASLPSPPPVRLEVEGENGLMGLAYGWTREEFKLKRRIVKFDRQQIGNIVRIRGRTIHPSQYQAGGIVVSCIFHEEMNECFMTSVDALSLLESLIGSHFTIEEKNRIRRNLEGYHPLTISKNKEETQKFFALIMSFPEPRPRNIEKDIKIFSWKILQDALAKTMAKFSFLPSPSGHA
ncbi:unnamed protein product [Sympodiomycopsis kandeliae]